jgi:kynurenine formamidase
LYRLALFNHCGTHIDAPNHYDPEGRKLVDFSLDEFVFENPLLVEIPKGDHGLITAVDCENALDGRNCCDLLLIRTGFGRFRSSDPARYVDGCPGVSGAAARLLKEKLPGLRAIGLDFISLEWTTDKSHGFEAHQILLKDKARPFLIIEDMNLDFEVKRLKRIFAIPIFFREIDSFPATVFAELE